MRQGSSLLASFAESEALIESAAALPLPHLRAKQLACEILQVLTI